MQKGSCSYVLLSYSNQPFLQIVEGTCFGLIDIVAACMSVDEDMDAAIEMKMSAHVEGTEEHSHECHEDCEHEINLLETWHELPLKRSFTAKCGD